MKMKAQLYLIPGLQEKKISLGKYSVSYSVWQLFQVEIEFPSHFQKGVSEPCPGGQCFLSEAKNKSPLKDGWLTGFEENNLWGSFFLPQLFQFAYFNQTVYYFMYLTASPTNQNLQQVGECLFFLEFFTLYFMPYQGSDISSYWF